MKKKNKKFYKLMKATPTSTEHFVEAEKAKEVEIYKWIETFIYLAEEISSWSVSETTSGTAIVMGDTQKKAVTRAKEVLDSVGKDKIIKYIRLSIEKYGRAEIEEDKQLTLF